MIAISTIGGAEELPCPNVTKSRLSVTAVVAFVLGLSFVLALPALWLGVRAIREINRGDGRLRGRGLAIAALALGGLGTLILALGCFALVLLFVQEKSHVAICTNNLRQLGEAVNKYYDQHGEHFPAATVPHASLAPERRLSWQAAVIAYLPEGAPANKQWEKRAEEIAWKEAWDAPANESARQKNVAPLLCPTFIRGFAGNRRGLTSYVGIAGVGLDAAVLSAGDPRAGFFGYDRTPTRSDISAGISATMMVVETTRDNGPWLAGGPPTVRGLDSDCDRYVGYERPFGGLHRDGLNVLWADGSVRPVHEWIEPAVFRAMARIARND